MTKESQLNIFKSIALCIRDNASSNRWLDPMISPEDIVSSFGDEEGICMGYNQLIIQELYTDLAPERLNNDAEIGHYVKECLEKGLYDEGDMRIYNITIEEDQNSVSIDLHANGIGASSDSIYPTFVYNETTGLWVAIEFPKDECPWVTLLSFRNYEVSLSDLLQA